MNESELSKRKFSKAKKEYEFDDLLLLVGGFGRHTLLLFAFICAISVPIGLQHLVQVFYGSTPKFYCVPSSSDGNDTCGVSECCDVCRGYYFKGDMTSAVTEVRL